MSRNLYVAAIEARSGKSLIVLGLMQLLSRRIQKLGLFRPVIRGGSRRDNDIELVRRRFGLELPYDAMYAVSSLEAEEMAADGRRDELLERVFAKCKEAERACDFLLCEGTDFTGVTSAFELGFNADVANQIGSPVLIVAAGQGKESHEIVDGVRAAREAFGEHGCAVTATIVNRVAPARLEKVSRALQRAWPYDDPVYVLPDDEMLGKPTVGEIVQALHAEPVRSGEHGLDRVVLNFKVGAMLLPEFLEHVEEGSLIITPGDRADVILGSLATLYSSSYPNVAGILLSGGLRPEHSVRRLIEGFTRPAPPIYSVPTDTYTTATNVASVHAVIAPDNDRKIAEALAVFESHVDVPQLESRIDVARSPRRTPRMFEYELIERARAQKQRIVLPEGNDDRILKACDILLRRSVVDVTLLGRPCDIQERVSALGLDVGRATLVEPERSEWQEDFAQTYFEMRKDKGATEDSARDTLRDVNYFATMMVHKGLADGMVSGAAHTTGQTIRPAFEIIGTEPHCPLVSSVFFMCLADRVLVYADCGVNPNPNPEQLAHIAISSARTAELFGIEPRIAMLSYATGDSARGEDVDKVREATRIAQELRPDLELEGPLQYDAAVDPGVARTKMPGSRVAGRATVFIFPDLNAGNNTYKAVQRSANAVAIGPVLQGLRRPVNDLSRGCTVGDVIADVAITAIQAGVVDGSPGAEPQLD